MSLLAELGGTVMPNNTLFGGTVAPNDTLFVGTVPPNSTLFGGTPDLIQTNDILFNGFMNLTILAHSKENLHM